MKKEKLEASKAAAYLKISVRTLERRVKSGEIDFTKDLLDKRKRYFRVADLDKLKEGRPNGESN